jgi:hypothetical protein
MTLPRSKLAIVHVAAKQLGLADDDYRALLRRLGGVDSASRLDQAGFDAVMWRLAELGFKSTSPRRPPPLRAGMASPPQTQLIRHLWATYTDGQGTDASLGKWLDGRFKVSALRFVDAGLARKAIAALRHMMAKQARKAAAGRRPEPKNPLNPGT